MQVSFNDNYSSFNGIEKWKIRGKDIKKFPEQIEVIKRQVKQLDYHPGFSKKNMICVIRSRDYDYLPDMAMTQFSARADKIPQYGIEVHLIEKPKTLLGTVKTAVKQLKSFFMPDNTEAYNQVKPYSIEGGGNSVKNAVKDLISKFDSGEVPRK